NPLAATVSRRRFLGGAGVAGLAAAAPLSTAQSAEAATPDGTPEQIHLTWGEDPSRVVVVSWASAAQSPQPCVQFGREGSPMNHTVHGGQRTYSDGLNGQTVFTYHARLEGLHPNTVYHYSITADNDSNAAQPFTASFRTAPKGRAGFRWTSFGDLATP